MIETERLIIRPFEDRDIDDIFAMRSDPDVMRFIREPQTKIQETYNWVGMITAHYEERGIGFQALIEKETEEFVGWCGLWILNETKEIEIGYGIRKASWGKGYATESAKRILRYGFEQLLLEKIVAVAYPENLSSIGVMKKLGMTCMGVGRFYDNDLVQYAITKDEFATQ